jgi:hypothetical protein
VEEQLFVRVRGHVQGPYDIEKLRSLVRRGQLSRMHEVSSDGSIWKQAATFPELFQSPSIDPVQTETPTHGRSQENGQGVETAPTSVGGRWHFAQNGAQKGPVTFDELKSLVTSGNVDGSALVWTDGMKEWTPAHTIDGLSTNHGAADSNYASVKSGAVDRDVTRTLSESLPWSRFIASVMYIIGIPAVLLGAVAIVLGARWSRADTIAGGGFSVLYGIVFLWGGHLLYRYCSDIAGLLRDPSMRRLDESLRSLRRFWIFLSIILIVLLVNALVAAIWVISIGVSLSGPIR